VTEVDADEWIIDTPQTTAADAPPPAIEPEAFGGPAAPGPIDLTDLLGADAIPQIKTAAAAPVRAASAKRSAPMRLVSMAAALIIVATAGIFAYKRFATTTAPTIGT